MIFPLVNSSLVRESPLKHIGEGGQPKKIFPGSENFGDQYVWNSRRLLFFPVKRVLGGPVNWPCPLLVIGTGLLENGECCPCTNFLKLDVWSSLSCFEIFQGCILGFNTFLLSVLPSVCILCFQFYILHPLISSCHSVGVEWPSVY